MDEDGRQVIYQLPSQRQSQQLPAVFTPDDVTFVVKDKFGENTFSINRLNLSVQRRTKNGSGSSASVAGSCSVMTGPEPPSSQTVP
jgi:hypothetical protein